MKHDPNLIRIGKFTHHRDRLTPEAWTYGRAKDDFHSLWREGKAYAELKARLHADGHLTGAGIQEKLRAHVNEKNLRALFAKAEETAGLARNSVLATRNSLRSEIDKNRDARGVREDALRAERRAFLRALEPGERTQRALLNPIYQDAIIEQPGEMSGIAEDVYARVEAAVIERAYPGRLAEAEAEAGSGLAISQAVEGFRAEIAEDGAGF